MNLQEEFNKLSQEEKFDFLVRNLDKQTAIDFLKERNVYLEEVAEYYPYDDVKNFILGSLKEYGLKVTGSKNRLFKKLGSMDNYFSFLSYNDNNWHIKWK